MKASPSATKGTINELMVVADLLERGFEVTRPVVDNGADCHTRIGGLWYSVQVKSGNAKNAFGGGNRRSIITDLVALVRDKKITYRSWRSPLPSQLEAE